VNAELRTRLSSILETLIVADEHLCAGVAQCVVRFVFGPPGIHRHRHSARNENAGKAHRPFRVIAHCHRHAVALFDAIDIHQTVGQRINVLESLGK
jgi:hypothetical protein